MGICNIYTFNLFQNSPITVYKLQLNYFCKYVDKYNSMYIY